MIPSARTTVSCLFLVILFLGCTGDPNETINCDNLAPPAASSFSAVTALVTSSGSKGCSSCHNTTTPIYGFNFEGPAVAYDALMTKMDIIYPQVASGKMPQNGTRWSSQDLQTLRSWYCYGGFYEGP